MTVTALASGGKDSTFAAYLADTQGWTVDELLTLAPEDPESMMFHTPNLDLVKWQAEAWGKRHRRVPIHGRGEAAEESALEHALEGERAAVVAGAIASSYQWSRVNRICYRVGRPLYAPLWGKAPGRVVREEIDAGLDIRLVHLSAEGLDPAWLGRRLDRDLLAEIERRHAEVRAVNVAGEGGEYETLVVDAPFFAQPLVLEETVRVESRGVHTLRVGRAHLGPRSARIRKG